MHKIVRRVGRPVLVAHADETLSDGRHDVLWYKNEPDQWHQSLARLKSQVVSAAAIGNQRLLFLKLKANSPTKSVSLFLK
jgi:hypothetical protein